MATTEKPPYTGIDKIDHFNQRHFQNEERERAMQMLLEEQQREAEAIEKAEQEAKDLSRTRHTHGGNGSMQVVSKKHMSVGVAALLAAIATEDRFMSNASYRGLRGKPYDPSVKRSNLTREDFPSRQAWRAHQREQEKAERKGLLYD